MNIKPVVISSSGLKNVVLNRYTENDDFIMVFGQQKIRMNSIFAEFISPFVSHLHLSDPTISMYQFDDLYSGKNIDFSMLSKYIFTPDIISLLHQISSGYTIEINADQAFKMRFASIILGNEELFLKINELFPPDFSELNINQYLKNIQCCCYFSKLSYDFDFSGLIDFISRNFYSIDLDLFLKLSRKMQLLIISNPNLKIKSEDSLYDIIYQIITNNDTKEEEEIDNVLFLEHIEYTLLSEEKLREFLSEFDFNQITNSLWKKLFQCFFIHFDKNIERIEKQNHSIKEFSYEYDGNSENRFNGIFDHLSKQFGGNVDEKGICKITASSVFKEFYPKYVTDFTNDVGLSSNASRNSWIMFDFKDRKVRPNNYSIRSWDGSHLKNWVIEGSNNQDYWEILDTRNDETSLCRNFAENTFQIQKQLGNNDYYRYIRLRQTGPNSKYKYNLMISAFELFGSLILV